MKRPSEVEGVRTYLDAVSAGFEWLMVIIGTVIGAMLMVAVVAVAYLVIRDVIKNSFRN